ncbi:hypothetical protein AVEN_267321-1 [Araneus ventricosus]|uniref:Uncharacterized protein n=1 Tax=Araneus ventricosus TaxID=182803 RepID=A0A4Y2DJF5_ARAVE|nr:hypothetical protein AVEN_267321-1 [Araneus ventricosus]
MHAQESNDVSESDAPFNLQKFAVFSGEAHKHEKEENGGSRHNNKPAGETFSYTPNTCGEKIRQKAVEQTNVPNSVEKKAWESEAWRRKAWVEAERISASESRNYGLASLCDKKRQIGDFNTFFSTD